MTNEELAALIQAGERERIPELWAQVEKYVWKQANRRALSLEGYGGVTEEDLYQSGFLALLDAVESYDHAAGMSFIGWAEPPPEELLRGGRRVSEQKAGRSGLCRGYRRADQ